MNIKYMLPLSSASMGSSIPRANAPRASACHLATLALSISLMAAAPASAQDVVEWENTDGGEFVDGGNWSEPAPPGPTQIGSFNNWEAAYNLSLSSSVTVGGLRLNDSIDWDIGWSSIISDFLEIANGGLGDQDILVTLRGSSDIVTLETSRIGWPTRAVDDAGEYIEDEDGNWVIQSEYKGVKVILDGVKWLSDYAGVNLGAGNIDAALEIRNGGVLEVSRATLRRQPSQFAAEGRTDILVTGSGSKFMPTWTRLGNGSITIEEGATATTNHVYVGHHGHVDIVLDGEGTLWDFAKGFWRIGIQGTAETPGTGSLTVSNGAHLDTMRILLGYGYDTQGDMIVTGPGSLVTFQSDNHDIRVGTNDTGSLLIENGGVVESPRTTAGWAGETLGEVTVTGQGSKLVDYVVDNVTTVGRAGEGHFTVRDGGAIEAQGMAVPEAGTGFLNVLDDGTLTVASVLSIGGAMDAPGGPGLLTLASGGSAAADVLQVHAAGTLEFILGAGAAEAPLAIRTTSQEGLDAAAGLEIGIGDGFAAEVNDVIHLIAYSESFAGSFEGLNEGGEITAGSYRFGLSYGDRDSASTVSLTVLATDGAPVAPTFDDWRQEHFTPEEVADDTISGPAADPDGDGLTNLLEFALAADPKLSSSDVLPEAGSVDEAGEEYLTIAFTRPAEMAGVTYGVEVSSNPGDWQPGGTLVSETAGENNTVVQVWRDDAPLSSSARRFIRLRATVE